MFGLVSSYEMIHTGLPCPFLSKAHYIFDPLLSQNIFYAVVTMISFVIWFHVRWSVNTITLSDNTVCVFSISYTDIVVVFLHFFLAIYTTTLPQMWMCTDFAFFVSFSLPIIIPFIFYVFHFIVISFFLFRTKHWPTGAILFQFIAAICLRSHEYDASFWRILMSQAFHFGFSFVFVPCIHFSCI